MSGLCVASISQRAFTSLGPGSMHSPWGGRAQYCGLAVVWPGALLLGSPGLTPAGLAWAQYLAASRSAQASPAGGPSLSEVQGLSPAHIPLPVREFVSSFVLGNTCPPAGLLFPGSPSQWLTQCAHTQVCLPGEVTTQ